MQLVPALNRRDLANLTRSFAITLYSIYPLHTLCEKRSALSAERIFNDPYVSGNLWIVISEDPCDCLPIGMIC
jgi:hypothetical protein